MVATPPSTTGRVRGLARAALLALAYWGAAELVWLAGSVGQQVSLFWPSAGIALAALLRWGHGYAAAIWVGAFAVGLSTGLPAPVAAALAVGNTLGPLVASATLGRLGFRLGFDRRRDLVLFLGAGVLLLPIPAALIGPSALCLAGRTACSGWLGTAAVWWMGDSLGVLMAAPVLLPDLREWWRRLRGDGMVVEAAAVLAGTGVASWLVFMAPAPPTGGPSLPLPFALWAALRLRRLGAGAAVLLLGTIAVAGSAGGLGPFGEATGPAAIWPYLTMVALVSFVVSTAIAEQEAAIDRLRASEQLARSALEAASEAILVADSGGRFVDANAAAVSLLGYGRDELLDRGLGDVLAPHELGGLEALLTELRARGRRESEWRLRRRDGSEIWTEASAVVLPDGRLQAIVRDVTQRRQAEAALRVSEARYRTIVDTVPECVKVVGASGELLEMNPAGLAMLEVASMAEVRGTPIVDLVAPEHRGAFGALHRQVMTGTPGELQFEIVGRRGTRRWLHTTAAPLRDDAGRPTALLGVTRDITRIRQLDQARLSATRRTEALVDALGQAVYEWDLTTGTITWGGRFEDVLGSSALEAPAATAEAWLARVHPEDREGLQRAVEDARRASRVIDQEYRIRQAGGDHVWVHDRAVFRPAEGEPQQVVGVLRDVTATVVARQRIRRLAAFPELSPAAVIEFGADGDITYWNRAADSMAREARAEGVAGLLPRHAERLIRECRESGEALQRVETTVGGRTYSATFLPIPALGTVHCYVTDVTRELQLRLHLEQSQRMESVGQLAGGIAHDFNNILQVISGFGALAADPTASAEDRDASLQQVLQAADRAAQLTRQLLAFSRRQPLRMVDLDLNDAVSGMLRMVRRVIGEHISVDFIPGYQLANVRADSAQVEQVLLNLCINARDAMAKGGRLTIETENVLINGAYRESHPWATTGRYVLLTVTDTGAGMEKAVLDRIFEPFFTTKAPDRGTGLGLAVVYGIIEQHGGMINAYSEPGVGTTFKVYLPAAERMASAIDSKVRGAPPSGTETVLVAEDDPQVRRLAVEILQRAGYQVIAARDGMDAVACFEQHADRIALVLLDLVMPGLGGPEAFQRIRALRPGVPVLFASGYGGQGLSPTFATDRGMTLIDKPYDPDRLLEEVRAAIDRERRRA